MAELERDSENEKRRALEMDKEQLDSSIVSQTSIISMGSVSKQPKISQMLKRKAQGHDLFNGQNERGEKKAFRSNDTSNNNEQKTPNKRNTSISNEDNDIMTYVRL